MPADICDACGNPKPGEGETTMVIAPGYEGLAYPEGTVMVTVPGHYGDFEVDAIGTITAIFDRLDDDESRGRVARYLRLRYAPVVGEGNDAR